MRVRLHGKNVRGGVGVCMGAVLGKASGHRVVINADLSKMGLVWFTQMSTRFSDHF